MSNWCRIVAKLSDNTYGAIRVVYEGDPNNALKTLSEHYTSQDKIDALINAGDCYCIEPLVGDCVPRYQRWDDNRPDTGPDLEYMFKHFWAEHRFKYRYVWDGHFWSMVSGKC